MSGSLSLQILTSELKQADLGRALISDWQNNRPNAASNIYLRIAPFVQAGFELASRKEAFFVIAQLYLPAVRVAAQCEVDAETGCLAKDDRIVGEQQLHLVWK